MQGVNTSGVEIERKFLLNAFPEDLPLLEESTVYQGYLCTDPVVRIRSKEKDGQQKFVLCFKGQGTLMRREIEMELTKSQFSQLSELLKAPMIRKDFRVYLLPDGHRLECSMVDRGSPSEFLYAEVEFASLEEAKVFEPPAFLYRDVTEFPGFSMSRYWETRKRPFTD